MKKSKIWIRTCVHLFLYITVAAFSSEIGNPITDDIKKISLLKQNIPKDYRIKVRYLPKEVSGMCWVKLNLFHLQNSLTVLSQKFGNISSNKDNLGTFIQMLREMRYPFAATLEDAMQEYECHYRQEEWPTGRYFEFVEDFFHTANSSRENVDCEPPPCPTTNKPTTTITTRTTITTTTTVLTQHDPNVDSSAQEGDKFFTKVLERSLLSLLIIPLMAIVFLLIWKMKSRRNDQPLQRSTDGPALISGPEASAPPLDDLSEKDRLSMIREV